MERRKSVTERSQIIIFKNKIEKQGVIGKRSMLFLYKNFFVRQGPKAFVHFEGLRSVSFIRPRYGFDTVRTDPQF